VPVIGSGENVLPVVYAGNVAAAIQSCLDTITPSGALRIFDLGLDRPLTLKGLLVGMAHALGHRPRILHIPGGLMRTAAGLGERFGLGVPGAGDPSLSRFTRLTLGDSPY